LQIAPGHSLTGIGAVAILAFYLACSITVSLVCCFPAWLALRWLDRESGWAVVTGGAVMGLAALPVLGRAGPQAATLQEILPFVLTTAAGAIAGLAFWAIARGHDLPPPEAAAGDT
jgi:hypothetical protein